MWAGTRKQVPANARAFRLFFVVETVIDGLMSAWTNVDMLVAVVDHAAGVFLPRRLFGEVVNVVVRYLFVCSHGLLPDGLAEKFVEWDSSVRVGRAFFLESLVDFGAVLEKGVAHTLTETFFEVVERDSGGAMGFAWFHSALPLGESLFRGCHASPLSWLNSTLKR